MVLIVSDSSDDDWRLPGIDSYFCADCPGRHPDVIAGTIAAAPVSSNPNFRPPHRGGRMSTGGNGYTFEQRQQHHFAKVQAMKQQQAQASAAKAPVSAQGTEKDDEKSVGEQDSAAAAVEVEESKEPQTLEAASPEATKEAKPEGTAAAPSATATAPVVNGVAPVLNKNPSLGPRPRNAVGGLNSRSHSPNHPLGGQRTSRGGGPRSAGPHHPNTGARSGIRTEFAKQQAAQKNQKLPSAADFPALAGSTGSLNGAADGSGSVVMVKPASGWSMGSKTAAQILSTPAPPKPVAPKQTAKTTASKAESGPAKVSLVRLFHIQFSILTQ